MTKQKLIDIGKSADMLESEVVVFKKDKEDQKEKSQRNIIIGGMQVQNEVPLDTLGWIHWIHLAALSSTLLLFFFFFIE